MTTRMEATRTAKRTTRGAIESLERAFKLCVAMQDDRGAAMLGSAIINAGQAEDWLNRDILATPEYWEEKIEVAP